MCEFYGWRLDKDAHRYLSGSQGVHHAYPDVEWSYAWVVVRNKPPFNVEVYECSPEYLELGRRRLEHRKLFYHECVTTGRWVTPTHGQICTVYPPRFAKEVV